MPPSLQTKDLSSSHFLICDGDDGVSNGGGGSDCRLINESKGMTFDLMKVESSNTYVMFPPPLKKSKIATEASSTTNVPSSKSQVRGRLLREKNTFFLECATPKQNLLRTIANHLQENCVYPSSRGISVSQLSQKYRYSVKEVLDVLTKKIRAFRIPPTDTESRAEDSYGVLSEDVEKDTWDVIISVLSEWDGAIDYAKKGVVVDEMVKIILSRGNEIEEHVVRYCLQQCIVQDEKTTSVPSSKLDATYIAQKIAHQMFNSQTAPWEQSLFLSEWHRLMPGVGVDYEPNVNMLRGIAISTATINPMYKNDEIKTGELSDGSYWKYFPKEALPTTDGEKIKAIFEEQERWTLEDLEPYFDAGDIQSILLKHTRRIDNENSVWYVLK